MSKQNETPFDGIKIKRDTEIFESTEIKNDFKTEEVKTKNGTKLRIPDDVLKAHTLTVEFDFTGLTVQEATKQLASTTSFMKLFQNNIIGNVDKRWSEQEILDTVKAGVYHVKVRDLLDNKKSRSLTPIQRAARTVKELRKTMSVDEVRAELERQLANLE